MANEGKKRKSKSTHWRSLIEIFKTLAADCKWDKVEINWIECRNNNDLFMWMTVITVPNIHEKRDNSFLHFFILEVWPIWKVIGRGDHNKGKRKWWVYDSWGIYLYHKIEKENINKDCAVLRHAHNWQWWIKRICVLQSENTSSVISPLKFRAFCI